ncbi:hypothetical protein FVE85_9884 [Porphyridium purpureum]|uniref:Uncharacterized protein n=1 Tax=Porphyridium purpureum TaxID=35688 RepID=A0A5J4YIX1_PORPP|nr:hypothetical protein FVE85_9884 [Porphyridium purpureum]|eukprot:POR3449..scf289_17
MLNNGNPSAMFKRTRCDCSVPVAGEEEDGGADGVGEDGRVGMERVVQVNEYDLDEYEDLFAQLDYEVDRLQGSRAEGVVAVADTTATATAAAATRRVAAHDAPNASNVARLARVPAAHAGQGRAVPTGKMPPADHRKASRVPAARVAPYSAPYRANNATANISRARYPSVQLQSVPRDQSDGNTPSRASAIMGAAPAPSLSEHDKLRAEIANLRKRLLAEERKNLDVSGRARSQSSAQVEEDTAQAQAQLELERVRATLESRIALLEHDISQAQLQIRTYQQRAASAQTTAPSQNDTTTAAVSTSRGQRARGVGSHDHGFDDFDSQLGRAKPGGEKLKAPVGNKRERAALEDSPQAPLPTHQPSSTKGIEIGAQAQRSPERTEDIGLEDAALEALSSSERVCELLDHVGLKLAHTPGTQAPARLLVLEKEVLLCILSSVPLLWRPEHGSSSYRVMDCYAFACALLHALLELWNEAARNLTANDRESPDRGTSLHLATLTEIVAMVAEACSELSPHALGTDGNVASLIPAFSNGTLLDFAIGANQGVMTENTFAAGLRIASHDAKRLGSTESVRIVVEALHGVLVDEHDYEPLHPAWLEMAFTSILRVYSRFRDGLLADEKFVAVLQALLSQSCARFDCLHLYRDAVDLLVDAHIDGQASSPSRLLSQLVLTPKGAPNRRKNKSQQPLASLIIDSLCDHAFLLHRYDQDRAETARAAAARVQAELIECIASSMLLIQESLSQLGTDALGTSSSAEDDLRKDVRDAFGEILMRAQSVLGPALLSLMERGRAPAAVAQLTSDASIPFLASDLYAKLHLYFRA